LISKFSAAGLRPFVQARDPEAIVERFKKWFTRMLAEYGAK